MRYFLLCPTRHIQHAELLSLRNDIAVDIVHLGALALLLEELGARELGDRVVADLARRLEVAERRGPTRMDDALRNALQGANRP